MKIYLILFVTFFCLNRSSGQSGFVLEPYTSFVAPKSNYKFSEAGTGYYDVLHKKNNYIEAGLLGAYHWDKFSVGLGYSYKTWKSSLRSTLNFGGESENFEHTNQYINRKVYGLSIGAGYKLSSKLRFALKIESNNPLRTVTNTLRPEQIEVFVGIFDEERTALLTTQTFSEITSIPVLLLEFRGTYMLTNSIGMYAELKTNVSKSRDVFRYVVRGRNLDNLDSSGPIVYNNITTTTDFLGLALGLSWTIDVSQAISKK